MAKKLKLRNKKFNSQWEIIEDDIPMAQDGGKYPLIKEGGYDIKRALELGYAPDETGHMPSRDYETGQYLKAKNYQTTPLSILYDELAGYKTRQDLNGNLYSIPREQQYPDFDLNNPPVRTFKNGGNIKTDPQGYWNKKNHGKPVRIPSNRITMKGVNQPLLGISDTGDIQYMQPNGEYLFDGNSVLELPLMQQGGRTPIYTSNPNDPRLQAYNDSLKVYNSTEWIKTHPFTGNYNPTKKDFEQINTNINALNTIKYKPKIKKTNTGYYFEYKKPVQPIIYRPTNERQNPLEHPIKIESKQADLLPTTPINLEIERIPFTKGTYFTRERQSQEEGSKQFGRIGKTDYFDKKTGKLLGSYKNGGKISDWEIIN